MIITRIEDLDKSRRKVYIDDEFAFVLYKGEFRIYGIKEGSEITQETLDKIRTETLSKRAKLRAMNLLTKREYTVAELARKLRDGFYPEDVISEALDYVASYHYTDDSRYALWYIGDYATSRSRKRIEQDLKAKGVSDSVIRNAFDEYYENNGKPDETEQIKRILEKRHYNSETADYKERSKQAQYLASKGYSTDAIFSVIKNVY